ncbi:MAG TPA: tail fiber domain-containing protein [Candidatus Babeliales bacterium]|jgi:hypothetical protein|nr:tail fiber domain-containing protein [Candidatus Babeliales bacterium]
MKIISSSQRQSLLLMVILALPLSLSATSQEFNDEAYVYCGENYSKMAKIVEEISKLDEDKNSPVCQLNDHIKKGFSIGRQDAVIESLAWAEEVLNKNYRHFNSAQFDEIQSDLDTVINAVVDGELAVDVQSLQDNESFRDKTLEIEKSVKFHKNVKFKDKVDFKHFVGFHGHVKFYKDVEFKDNVTVDGTLSAAAEVVDCDLTVGCNINLNNSSSSAVGNVLKAGASFIHNFGSENTFVGVNAGNFGMSGDSNTGFGDGAMHLNTSGSSNTAVGTSVLSDNTTGSLNTGVGSSALSNNTTGEGNTAVGQVALLSNTTGSGNTAVGVGALAVNTFGSSNTAVGLGALSSNITGSGNIACGEDAGNALIFGDDNIYIGNVGLAVETGFVRIGTPLTHIETYIQGIFGSSVGVGGLPVEVDSTGKLGTIVSSRKFKKNIADMNEISANIYKLRPVTFEYNNDATDAVQYGLIAEEVAAIFPSLIAPDKDGNPFSVRYQVLPVLLLNEVQKQQASIANLIERVDRLEKNAPAA